MMRRTVTQPVCADVTTGVSSPLAGKTLDFKESIAAWHVSAGIVQVPVGNVTQTRKIKLLESGIVQAIARHKQFEIQI